MTEEELKSCAAEVIEVIRNAGPANAGEVIGMLIGAAVRVAYEVDAQDSAVQVMQRAIADLEHGVAAPRAKGPLQ